MKNNKILVAACLLLASGFAMAEEQKAGEKKAGEKDSSQSLPIVEVSKDTVMALMEKRLEQRFVPGEVVVKMKQVRAMPSAILGELQLKATERVTSGGETIYKIQPPNIRAMTAADIKKRTLETVAALKQKPGVLYAQPNYIFQITATPNDPGYPLQWHYFDNGSAAGQADGGINLPKVWENNKGAAEVVVAVIDTGILKSHSDISGSTNLLDGYDMISDAFTGNDGNGRDSDATDTGDAISAGECYPGSPSLPSSWHGTHVAGTIGVGKTNNNSGVAGVNWNVKVLPVRVLGKCGGTMLDINDAIRWAAGIHVNGVPDNTSPARVINMSLGGAIPCTSSPATQAAINDAVAQGATVVVAAGNDAKDASGFVPAGCDNVVSVAAGDRNGRLVSRYSNYGAVVDVMAPGGDVNADTDGDNNPDGVLSMVEGGYAFYNGTSMAAPHVAGVAALMLAANPGLTPAQVESQLKAKALPRDSSQCPKPCGAGLLNAEAADNSGQPPPQDVFNVSVTPSSIALKKGKTDVITATLKKNGSPQANQQLQFKANNTSVATVSAASKQTDAQGKAEVTVSAKEKGQTEIVVNHGSASATVKVNVEEEKKGAMSVWYLAILLLFAVLALKRRRVVNP